MIKLTEQVKNVMVIMTTFLLIIAVMQGCGKGKKLRKIQTTVTESIKQDSISDARTAIFMKEFQTRLTISALKAERATLHNMNEIVLTNQRPATRIAEINTEIDALEAKLTGVE